MSMLFGSHCVSCYKAILLGFCFEPDIAVLIYLVIKYSRS